MSKQSVSEQVDFVTIREARSFDVPESGTSVIKSGKEWENWLQKYWNQFSGNGEKTPPPEIDFDKEMVVAICWGSGYSGCSNTVEVIKRIEKTIDSINVVLSDLPNLGPCDMEVYPIQMVRISNLSLPVHFSGSIPQNGEQ